MVPVGSTMADAEEIGDLEAVGWRCLACGKIEFLVFFGLIGVSSMMENRLCP